ncbi:MAG: hypothetical protein ACREFP_09595 [Acetobacteraceae bacterium]
MKRRVDSAVVLFDVTYADGSRSSRRKVPKSVADGQSGEAAVKAAIEAQDREIALSSGRDRGPIKAVVRSAM